MEKVKLLCLILPVALIVMGAHLLTPVKVLKTTMQTTTQESQPTDSEIAKAVRAHIDAEKYREVRVQVIRDEQGKPSHYLVHLHSKTSHGVDFARINIDPHFKVLSVQLNYQLQDIDLKQQPGIVQKNITSPAGSH
jgi:hypothetical protein